MSKCNTDCCCNCIHQIKLMKHPWNQREQFKGSISEHTGLYACTLSRDMDSANGKNFTKVEVLDKGHGLCEGHVRVENE